MHEVRCDAGVVHAILAHARRDAPKECCGVLVGRGDEIVEAVATKNLSDNPDRFLLDPAGHIAVRRAARERGLSVLGFYHSHPHSAARPSARDRDEASYPDHLYAIVSLQHEAGDVRLFKLAGGEFEEVALVY